jgi:nucleoside-diphosphate-sugar epimerase
VIGRIAMNLFMIGFGYVASRLVANHADRFGRVAATMRSAEKRERVAERLRDLDLDLFDDASVDAGTLAKCTNADIVLISVPPGSDRDVVLDHLGAAIAGGRARRVIYLSTIGVYGDHRGEWIDEDTPPAPEHDRTRARIALETEWRRLLGDRLSVLRLGGIYGPGRNALVELRAGRARRIVKPGQVFNRIHADDAARAILGAIDCGSGGVWNICDDEPAPPQDVIAYAAQLMGIDPPPEQPFATAELSPMARSFYASNRRVRNDRAKLDLGLRFLYPDYRRGLDALWAAGDGAVP